MNEQKSYVEGLQPPVEMHVYLADEEILVPHEEEEIIWVPRYYNHYTKILEACDFHELDLVPNLLNV